MDGNVAFQHAPGEGGREMETSADRKPARLRGRPRCPHEIATRNAVPVQEYEQVRVARERTEIPGPGGTKALVRVPAVREPLPETSFPALDDERSLGAGAVVGDHDVEPPVRLVEQRVQDGVERFGPLVRADDDGQTILVPRAMPV